jgi:hypothetical protein
VKKGVDMQTRIGSFMLSTILFAVFCLFAAVSAASAAADTSIVAVKVGDKWGFKDVQTNKIIIRPQFDSVSGSTFTFSEGLGAVELNGKWGFIDKTGAWVIEPQFEFADRFREGLALISVGGSPLRGKARYTFQLVGGKWGFVDKSGDVVIEAKFDKADGFSEGLAAVRMEGKWGFIDSGGKIKIQSQFDEANQFNDGFAGVKMDDKWGFIDKTGQSPVKPQFDDVSWFSEGLSAVRVGNKWGYIDKAGKMIVAPKFDDPFMFISGQTTVSVDGRTYVIDRTGQGFGEWEYVTGSTSAGNYYYDPKSFMRSKDIVKTWIKSIPNEEIVVRKTLWEIGCSQRNIRTLSSVTYGVEGKVIAGFSQPTDWEAIIPETVGDAFREELCKKKEEPKKQTKPAAKRKGK